MERNRNTIATKLAVLAIALATPATAQDASRDRSDLNRAAPRSWADEVVSAIGESGSGRGGGAKRGRNGGAGAPGSLPAVRPGAGGGQERGKGGGNR
jgi:hypothetical protein